MLVNRKIVDEFLEGKDISREWIFSEIQQGEYLFDLSDLNDKQEEVKKLTDKISDMLAHFKPDNEKFYRQLFPDFEKELADCEVMLTVGVPAPYDAMVIERNDSKIIVFDMGRFLSYKDPQGFAQQMMTQETAHAMLHKKWQLKDTASYQEQLRFLCFDEGFAHLLACGKEIASFDASMWIQEHYEPALTQLHQALPCEDESQQEEWLYRAQTGRYWDKFAAIAGKLYLISHLDELEKIYLEGPQKFMSPIFDPLERN